MCENDIILIPKTKKNFQKENFEKMKVNSLWLLPVVLPVLPVSGKLTARKIIPPEVCLEKVEDLRVTSSATDGTVECNSKHCSVKCQDGYQ